MPLDQPTPAQSGGAKPEPDYDPDGVMALLTELQMRDLMKLRQIGMDLADDVTAQGGDATLVVKGHLDRAFERISGAVLRIMAMEQHTARVRAGAREALRVARVSRKKAEVRREVEAVLDAVAKAPVAKVGPEAARVATLPRLPRLNLLDDILVKFDFSDQRTVASMVAEICAKWNVPFPAEHWPAAAAPAAAEEPRAAEKRSPPMPPRPAGALGSVSSIGLMAQTPSGAKGRGPP